MKKMKIYDSLSKKMKEIEDKEEIRIYTCGPTVYDKIHLGNARMLVVFDLLHRFVKFRYKNVKFAQNITDIDDKIIERAELENRTPEAVAEEYTNCFLEDCDKLNLLPVIRPKATEFLQQMNDAIGEMIDLEVAYQTETGVYLDTSKVDYGKFEVKENKQQRVAHDKDKKNDEDFALWKHKNDHFYYPNFPEGKPGRPGWHLECYVMSKEILGLPFDIHGGGIDLKFPHHENEIAESEACNHGNPAKIWMHNNMLNINNHKMSKSEKNFKYLRDVVNNRFSADVFKYFIYSTHYRNEAEFSEDSLKESEQALMKIRRFYFRNIFEKEDITLVDQNHSDLDDFYNDLDTPKVIQKLHLLIKNEENAPIVKTILEILGFNMRPLSKMTKSRVQVTLEIRQKRKDMGLIEEADKLRKTLESDFIEVNDTATGFTWNYK